MKFFIVLFTITFMACNNHADKRIATKTDSMSNQDTVVVNSNKNITGCYIQVIQKDRILASLQQEGNQVTGTLLFDNYEKDGSTGTVRGRREGNILQLKYAFQSEGTNSVMDVFFKIKDDQLVRGIADMKTKGDTVYFADPSQVTYPPTGIMHKIPCDSLRRR